MLGQAPGDPLEVEVEWFGPDRDVVATVARRAAAVQWLQHASGPMTPAVLDEVVDWYAARSVGPRIELLPAEGYEVLAARLHSAGLHQSSFSELLRGAADVAAGADADARPAGVVVEALAPEPSEEFGRTLLAGHEVPDDADPAHWWAASRFPTLPTHRAFLARDAATGEPMGAALLVVHDGVGYLANASTVPAARGRGAQTALIRARATAAAEAGCEVVESIAVPWSGSNRNLRRAGLAVVHTGVQWTPAPLSPAPAGG